MITQVIVAPGLLDHVKVMRDQEKAGAQAPQYAVSCFEVPHSARQAPALTDHYPTVSKSAAPPHTAPADSPRDWLAPAAQHPAHSI